MKRTRTRKCMWCGDLFEPDPRNAKRQKCCAKQACRAALKAARQRRWLEKPENRDYFRGPEHVERVRAWRVAHPGYWRSGQPPPADALQDGHGAQGIEPAKDFATPAAHALQGRAFLAEPRRRERSEGAEDWLGDARLKMSWTKPRRERHGYGDLIKQGTSRVSGTMAAVG